MSKVECRRLMKAKLSLMDEVELNQLSSFLSKNLDLLFSELLVIQNKRSIGAFAPMSSAHEAFWYLKLSDDCLRLTAYPFLDSQMEVMSFKKASLSDLIEREDNSKKLNEQIRDYKEIALDSYIKNKVSE